MNATMVKEDDLREKIKTVMSRLDRMDSRVKEIETTTAAVAKLETKIAHVIARVEKVESRVDPSIKPELQEEIQPPKPARRITAPVPVKAFAGGVSIGLLIVGLIVVAWLLGLF